MKTIKYTFLIVFLVIAVLLLVCECESDLTLFLITKIGGLLLAGLCYILAESWYREGELPEMVNVFEEDEEENK